MTDWIKTANPAMPPRYKASNSKGIEISLDPSILDRIAALETDNIALWMIILKLQKKFDALESEVKELRECHAELYRKVDILVDER